MHRDYTTRTQEHFIFHSSFDRSCNCAADVSIEHRSMRAHCPAPNDNDAFDLWQERNTTELYQVDYSLV